MLKIVHPKMVGETIWLPKSVATAMYFMHVPTSIITTAKTPVKRAPLRSRIIPPKMSISRNMLKRPYPLVKIP